MGDAGYNLGCDRTCQVSGCESSGTKAERGGSATRFVAMALKNYCSKRLRGDTVVVPARGELKIHNENNIASEPLLF